MTRNRLAGQALVELALCAPVVILLAIGCSAVVQVLDGSAGLRAATQEAASAAVRAPDATTAIAAARARFSAIAAGYPIRAAVLRVAIGDFGRGAQLTLSATAWVDVGWAALVVPDHVALEERVVLRIDPWRTRRSGP